MPDVRARVGAVGRRVRSLAHRLTPSLTGTTSLATDTGLRAAVERSIEIFPAETVSCLQPRATPAQLTYDFAPREALLFRDVTFWPSWGVAEHGGRLIEDTAFSPARVKRLIDGRMVKRSRAIGRTGVYTTLHVGLPWHNHYHWLIDSLPRVYALHHPALRQFDRITLLLACALTADEDRLLRALLPPNVDVAAVGPRARIKPSRFLFLPFLSADSNGHLPEIYVRWLQEKAYETFDVSIDDPPSRRIFMSRRNAPKRRLLNEDAVFDALRPLGFENVRPDELPLGKQIELFCNTAFAAGQHGAAFANLVFMRGGATLEICSRRDPRHLRFLASAMRLDYGQVADDGATRNQDFSAPVETVRAQVQEMLQASSS